MQNLNPSALNPKLLATKPQTLPPQITSKYIHTYTYVYTYIYIYIDVSPRLKVCRKIYIYIYNHTIIKYIYIHRMSPRRKLSP